MTFTTAIDNLYVPYQPKLSAETIAKLKSMVMIWTSFNKNISDNGKAILDVQLFEQRSLATLKSFPKVFDLLSCALDKSWTELPTFLFNCEHPMDIEEKQLFKVVQFVLTDFAGKNGIDRKCLNQNQNEHFGLTRLFPFFNPLVIKQVFLVLNGAKRSHNLISNP
ncbi:hypothetical protein G6F35_010678 [Rhizopus arrhizus]|nr:hypothetical protein G6F35_010678 [Rhizopus arrhizus]